MKQFVCVVGIVLLSCNNETGITETQENDAVTADSNATEEPADKLIQSLIGIWKFDIETHMNAWQTAHNTEATESEWEQIYNMYTDAQLTLNADGTYDLWMPIIEINGPGKWAVSEDSQWLVLTKNGKPSMRFFISEYGSNSLHLLPDGKAYWPAELESVEFMR